MLTINPSYKEELHFNRHALLEYFKLIPKRWAKNRAANAIFTVYFAPVFKYMSRMSEDQLKEYWSAVIAIVHEMETANKLLGEAKEHPNFQPLAEIAQKHLAIVALTPINAKPVSVDAMKVYAKAIASLRYGAMKE